MMRTRRLFHIATYCVILGLLLSGCSQAAPQAAKPGLAPTAPSLTPLAEQPKYGGILKHAALQDENTFDLHNTGRNLAAEQAGPCYSGLLQVDPADGRRIIPDLAENYQFSPDGKKVTFTLRQNVRWHDGNAFTSEDVKFNFSRWMKPPQGVAIIRPEIVDGVERVETPDANTVEVYLKAPKPSFISGISLVYAAMLPPQYLKDHKTMEYTILGTGPFKLKEYKRGVSLEYVKNQDYFVPGRPYLDSIMQYIIPEGTARLAAFRTGQVRVIAASSNNMTASQAEVLTKEMPDRATIARISALSMNVLHLNLSRPPFNDSRVRQAIDMALDRKKVVEVMEGKAEISGPMVRGRWAVPDDELLKMPGYRGVTTADIEKARALLAEAGYPKGFETEGLLGGDTWKKQLLFVQDQLKDIGINVSIKMVDTATMEKRYVARDFAMSAYTTAQAVDDPDLFLALYLSGGGRNYSNFSDKQVDDWYREQSMTMDEAKRKEILLNMQRRILDLAPPILYTGLIDIPYWKCVKGYYPEKQVGYHNNQKRQDVWLGDGCG